MVLALSMSDATNELHSFLLSAYFFQIFREVIWQICLKILKARPTDCIIGFVNKCHGLLFLSVESVIEHFVLCWNPIITIINIRIIHIEVIVINDFRQDLLLFCQRKLTKLILFQLFRIDAVGQEGRFFRKLKQFQ